MAYDPYAKAIGSFLNLVEASASHRHDRPRRLALDSGLPPSSGYRAIATLEATQFLARDLDGVYAPGRQLWRVGLNAWGLGALFPGIEPVLARLRRDTRRTAFAGIVAGREVSVGPYSSGRGYDFVVPEEPVLHLEAATETNGITRLRTGPLVAEVASVKSSEEGAEAVVGIFRHAGASEEAADTGVAIRSAAARLCDAGKRADGRA